MPALPLANTFNGGTDGVAISAANSGGDSGDAFQSVVGTLSTYTNVQTHSPPMAMRIVDTTVSTGVVHSGFGSLTVDVFFRANLWLAANPTTNLATFLHLNDNAANRSAAFAITASGFIRSLNAAAGTSATGVVAVPLSQWFRVEARVLASTTAGQLDCRLYASADSGVLTDSISTTNQVLGANVDSASWGLRATTPVTPFTIYFDDVATSTTGWLGPAMIPPQPMSKPNLVYLRKNI